MATGRTLPINSNASGLQMAETIFGSGTTVVRASYTGDARSSGIYSNGDSRAPDLTPGDTGVILSTGQARSVTQSGGDPNRSASTTTDTSGPNNNAQFNAAAGAPTYDAAWLDVDFIPTGSVMTMQFVFASEEFPEYATGQFQDFLGVWINGTQVPLAVGDGDIDPNNLNAASNPNLFLNNTNDAYNTEMDGLTITLTLTIPVNSGVVNSIRIGIADVLDSQYDSNVLIAANSLQTVLVAQADSDTMYATGSRVLDVLGNDVNATGGSLVITHINGTAVSAGGTVTLASGQTVQLNADGTLTLLGNGDIETVNFTYTVASTSTGVTDVGFVTVAAIPCFVAGTLVRTPQGEAQVETLQPGDLVITRDDGPQPLRWIGSRTVAATGDFAPIHIRANTFGAHRDLWLSPEHRVLIRDALADLMFGEPEVLVAVKHLVNDRSVRRVPGGEVTYVHMMFDRHQVVFSEGLETESYLPGPQTAHSFETGTLAEICALFPELDPETGAGYSGAARRTLRAFEARLLISDRRVA